ncbi:sensor histidine kinase [Stakelama saccharophila]|uniref:histidine kinase n=1 Tax=Stakelama saccharophila TaxID=3075605 RepID=A0ABZ0BDW1_9SPHN|nr:response regulator [Stakelama sp. W311]WNO54956.1 response regulator [Stakelama sp. W311]
MRILYIDDDAGLRRLAERALTRRGFHVRTAANGPEGLALLDAERFDLVAIDHYMPGQDGLQVLATIRERPDAPPVVYVTGSDETRVAVAALKAGAADYVVKTVGEAFFDLLSRSFEQAVRQVALEADKRRAERELRESLARLETMLGEVHHRVANSLQLVSAFVNMQLVAGCSDETREALIAIQGRIDAIGQVHRRLYTSNHPDSVRLDEYLDHLLRDIGRSLSSGAPDLVLRAQPLVVKPDHAISIGIIVAELSSNAIKYAYPGNSSGEVRVCVEGAGEGFAVRVEDDGIGMPADGKVRGTGLGMRVIDAMARSVGGTICRDDGAQGAAFRLDVPPGVAMEP